MFPINPVWPVRDPGWYEVFQELCKADQANMKAWFPAESGILEQIEQLHAAHPNGYSTVQGAASRAPNQPFDDMSCDEMVFFVEEQVRRAMTHRWANIRRAIRKSAQGFASCERDERIHSVQ